MLKLTAMGGGFLALLGAAVLWPTAQLLFAAHMAQHLLLVVVAAPLFVVGGVSVRTRPLIAWTLFVATFLFWHWPVAFRWAAEHPAAQVVELGSILISAWYFWSMVLGKTWLGDAGQALMIMAAAIVTDLPGVVMLFAPRAICTMPGEDAARFGLSPLSDQQLAGLLMWVPANLVFFAVATFVFARWIRGERLSESQPAAANGLRLH